MRWEWCRAALAEAAGLDAKTGSDWPVWETVAPLLWREPHRDAGEVGPLVFLEEEFDDDSAGYVEFIMDWSSQHISKAKDSGPIQAAVRAVRNEQAILSDSATQTISRYSEMLDRELYRALKALREAQAWRLEALEVLAGDLEGVELGEVMGAG